MKLGLTSITFRKSAVKEVFEYAKNAGVEGIEWGVCENHMEILSSEKAQTINALSNEYGIKTISLGSYCYMTDSDEIIKTVETAHLINAPIIRVWAGKKGSADCSREEYDTIINNTVMMAECAKKYGIGIGFEYHRATLTDTAESAVKLIKDVNMDNVGLYWQPNAEIPLEKNLNNFNIVKPYLIGNLHIHNYTSAGGYMPLSDIKECLVSYYSDIKSKDYNVIIEFTKDNSPESLIGDADVLKSIIK